MIVQKRKRTFLWLSVLGVTMSTLIMGCDESLTGPTGNPGTYFGELTTLGNGVGRSFITIGDDGEPVESGVIISRDALEGLPDDIKTLYFLDPPAEDNLTIFDHYEMRYWPHGHDPQELFAIEHFDFIPFLISQAERDAIVTATAEDSARVLEFPKASEIPVGFAQIPNVDEFYAEPRYGTRYFHVVSFTPVLTQQAPYTTTIFYGYNAGDVNFLEIPVTFPYLMGQPNETVSFELPRDVSKAGYWPSNYSVSYDASSEEYTFGLGGFEYREP